jgi:predicted membrane-bound dolichyl-phosphate-mannose-protein mannosyltransferase
MTGIKRALLAVTLLASMAATLYAGETNPSAAVHPEQSAEKWTRYDWNASTGKGGNAGFEIEGGEDGGRLRVNAVTPDDARFVRVMAVEPATVYRLSCRVRTQNVGATARGAGISVSGIIDGSRDIKGNSGWESVDFYGKTGADQRRISVTVGVGGYGSLNSGSAWFEDVKVEKVKNVPPGVKVTMLESQTATAQPSVGQTRHGGKIVAAFGCFGLLLLVSGIIIRRRRGNAHEGMKGDRAPLAPARKSADRTDVAVMTLLTALCLGVSLYNLGGHSSPETGWQPAAAGEAMTVELGRATDLSRVYYYCGINDRTGDGGKFTLSARNSEGAFVPLISFTKDDVEIWKFADIAIKTNALRLTADTPNSRLNEIAFVEKGSLTPLKGLTVGDKKLSDKDLGRPENLIDEQGTFEYAPSFRTGFYFDEIYHARSAWEMLHQIEPFETTHPPLGKLLISSGIALFGMNAFGWRIAGALFGVALVPLMYLFGLKLFRNRFFAFSAAFLMMADFMRFAQSRVAVIDVYGVFFIMLMYYFILDLFPEEGERPPRNVNASLLMAGVAFGIGAACKWIALYACGGIALLVAFRTMADLKRRDFSPASGAAKFLLQRTAVCLTAFVAIPAVIYLLAYLPYMALPGSGHDLAGVFRLQAHMLNYHRTLQATHPFASPWWSWLLDLRPIWMYMGSGLASGSVSTIASFGNPAIWWLTIPAVAGAILLIVRRRDARLGVVLTALLFQYLPWIGIHRLEFIYHFFSAVPFVILCIVAILKETELRFPSFRAATWGYLAVTAVLFCLFYPVLSGLSVPQTYVAELKWLPTWVF